MRHNTFPNKETTDKCPAALQIKSRNPSCKSSTLGKQGTMCNLLFALSKKHWKSHYFLSSFRTQIQTCLEKGLGSAFGWHLNSLVRDYIYWQNIYSLFHPVPGSSCSLLNYSFLYCLLARGQVLSINKLWTQ